MSYYTPLFFHSSFREWLCETFSLDPDADVIRHYDVTGKICPKYYVENEDAWLAFRANVRARIEEDKTANGETN